MITLLVVTDGRAGCLTRAVASMHQLHGPISRRVLHDDTGDLVYHEILRDNFPDWEIIGPPQRRGFSGAYRNLWQWLRDNDDAPYVLMTEDDFRFTRAVDLTAMATVLDAHPELAQIALRRQPWNAAERAAGGIVEANPGAYTDHTHDGHDYLTHRQFFTTNPSLMRRVMFTDHMWPDGVETEGRFSKQLFTDPDRASAYWGARDSGEWVEHIGKDRVGHGY